MKGIHLLPLTLAALLPFPALAQQVFPAPEEAAQALVDALGTEHADTARLDALLGKNWRDFIPVDSVDRSDVQAFLTHYGERHAIEPSGDNQVRLSVGTDPWTLPIPLSKGPKGWSFDLKAGAEEIRTRRVGRNELSAIESTRAFHDAETEYAEIDRDGDGVLEYAQKLVSTDGSHDGLFWSDDDSGQISPLGPLFGDAAPGGEWHGYRFRILSAQGASAPGGAYDYRIGDDMTRGFALVAWPGKYGDSGIKTFIISHEGEVFEKDLGPDGEQAARAMKLFDPDDSWTQVADAPASP